MTMHELILMPIIQQLMDIDPLFWERNMGLSKILNLFNFLGEIST
jgi:hypothetical protein